MAAHTTCPLGQRHLTHLKKSLTGAVLVSAVTPFLLFWQVDWTGSNPEALSGGCAACEVAPFAGAATATLTCSAGKNRICGGLGATRAVCTRI